MFSSIWAGATGTARASRSQVIAYLAAFGLGAIACDGKHDVDAAGSDRLSANGAATSVPSSAEPTALALESHPTVDPVEPECLEKQVPPERLGDESTIQAQFPDFFRLYETGEFRMGACLAEGKLTADGRISAIRIVHPEDLDERVKQEIIRVLQLWRYEPGTLCGRPIAIPFTVSFGHGPVAAVRQTSGAADKTRR